MNNCEHYEMLVSTWLDGQLDRSEQVECFDHVVRCESCRGFYVDARALDGLVASVRTPAEAEEPSRELWKRIEWATARERRKPSRRGLPLWALQAAAVLVLAVGLSAIVWNGGIAPAPEQAEVLLGQDTDMTETRFVELTRDLVEPLAKSIDVARVLIDGGGLCLVHAVEPPRQPVDVVAEVVP